MSGETSLHVLALGLALAELGNDETRAGMLTGPRTDPGRRGIGGFDCLAGLSSTVDPPKKNRKDLLTEVHSLHNFLAKRLNGFR